MLGYPNKACRICILITEVAEGLGLDLIVNTQWSENSIIVNPISSILTYITIIMYTHIHTHTYLDTYMSIT